MKVRNLLRYARRSAGLSQRELAERVGAAQPTVARIESGSTVPRADTLARLLQACGLRLTVEPSRGQGVDRTVIRELLQLTPDERLRRAATEARNLAALEACVRR